MKVADGVFLLDISGTLLGQPRTIHPTLLVEGDTVFLVDTGYPGQLPQLREAVEQEGVSFEKISKVILTHQDIDHIGGLSAILRELPGPIEVLAGEDEKAYIQGDKRPHKLAQLEDNLATQPEERKAFYEKLRDGFQHSYVHVDATLADGEILPYLGGIRIISTPGHTLGHICLYVIRSKTLIAGDTLQVQEGRLTLTAPAINYDQGLYRMSIEKLTGYDIREVICYHGGQVRTSANEQIAALANQQ